MGLSNYLPTSAIAKPGVCTSSTRPASPYEGQVIYETDTDKTLVWNGSAWVYLSTSTAGDVGLVKVIPTSVSSAGGTAATLSADGTVTIGNGNTSISLNGCYTSQYDNYRVSVRLASPSGSMSLYWRFRTAGVDNTDLAYNWAYYGLSNAGATISTSTGGQNYCFVGVYTSASGLTPTTMFDVMSPALAEESRIYNFGYYRGVMATYFGGANLTSAVSHDGFTIYPSAGSISGGTIRVYGYRN